MLIAIVVSLIIFIILLRKFSFRKLYENVVFYIKVSRSDFETLNKLADQDIVIINQLLFKVAFVHDPQLISNILSSNVCMDKPMLFYTMMDIDLGMISAPS